MEDKQVHFNDVARRALAEYDMTGYTLEFIRHSDNVTFKVESPGIGTYLLRIHVPITEAMGTHGADSTAINSELLWLEALNQNTDLVLQKPVRNRTGTLVTPISADDATQSVNCTLMHWLNGQPYHRDLESEKTAYQIGEILAKLHTHASQWKIPEGFKRPERGVGYFEGVLRGIQPALKEGRISASDYSEFETSIALLSETLRSLDDNRQNYGIMHADAHKGNMLLQDGEIRLIDFSFCAFGNFMFDLGVCFSDMKESLHRDFLEGYQSLRALPDGHQRLIEGFFIGSVVGTFSYWVTNPYAKEKLATKAAEIARNYAAKFNRGEYSWFF
jgi:Ser/Thr protein kinase RdoA (MazF antagonist)